MFFCWDCMDMTNIALYSGLGMLAGGLLLLLVVKILK